MKLERKEIEVQQMGTMKVVDASIKATAKTFDMFENGTYSNKPVAILRELVANGIDSHTMAGTPDRPVEVTLPTEENPYFKVRDFGIGMSESFLTGPFMEYSNGSTKDGTDEVIGGFGIGSKSPFGYTDQYPIRSVHDGMLTIGLMFKSAEGIPRIGIQVHQPTDEPNGVEVSFPVQDGDIDAFRTAAQTALQYFRPLPIVENGTVNPPDYTYVGDNWALRPSAGDLAVIVGGVRYPVATASLEYGLRSDPNLSPLLAYGIDLTMPIGSVGIAMSREGLSYTPKTSESIKAALEAVINDVVATFANMFDNEPSRWAATLRLYKEIGGNTNNYSRNARQQLLAANAVYQGEKLTTQIDVQAIGGFKGWLVPKRQNWGRKKSLKNPAWETPKEIGMLLPGEIEQIIIDDLPDTPKSKTRQRMEDYLTGAVRDKAILIIRTTAEKREDPNAYDKILADLGGPQDFITTSSLPEPVTTAKAAKVANVRPRVRMFTWTGKKQSWTGDVYKNITPGGDKDVSEIKYADQPDNGIMVVMSSFDLPADFHKKMNTGLIGYSELHFVNVGDWEKLKGGKWEKFEDVFDARLKFALAAAVDLPQKLALDQEAGLGTWFNLIRRLGIQDMTLTGAAANRPFGKILALYQRYVLNRAPNDAMLAKFVEPKLPAGVKPDQLVKGAEDQAELYLALRMANQAGRIAGENLDVLVDLIKRLA